ncbi:MAG: Lrp/AsnC family transcriptional regulator [Candidatus Micrarchaeota archaeon]
MDELDVKLVKLLQANAKQKHNALAKELGVSEGTVRNRIARLEKDKIIHQYTALVDPKMLGYNAVAYIGIGLEPLKFLSVLESLLKIDDIHSVSTCTGEHTIIFEIWKRDAEEMAKFINERISTIPGISKISTNIVVEQMRTGRKEAIPGGIQTTLLLT